MCYKHGDVLVSDQIYLKNEDLIIIIKYCFFNNCHKAMPFGPSDSTNGSKILERALPLFIDELKEIIPYECEGF